MNSFIVKNPNKLKIRLDHYLVEQLQLSRTQVQQFIKKGFVKINGEVVTKSGLWLCNLDKLEVLKKEIIDEHKINFASDHSKLTIVYEDDDLMVVNKPSGLLSHPTRFNETNTLSNSVIYYFQQNKVNLTMTRNGIAHRLDRDTSGLMLVAKNSKVLKILLDDFANHRIVKKYLAIVVGRLPSKRIKINLPIGRSDFNSIKMQINGKKNLKNALTSVEEIDFITDYSFVECQLHTGRTHQIRLHLAHLGNPILNDKLYGSAIFDDDFGQYLHAYYLEFIHPTLKKKIEIKLPLPVKFKLKVQQLGFKKTAV